MSRLCDTEGRDVTEQQPPDRDRGSLISVPVSVGDLAACDEAASVAHDFIWGKNGVTKQQASVAIWRIHNALRPHLPMDAETLEAVLREVHRDA